MDQVRSQTPLPPGITSHDPLGNTPPQRPHSASRNRFTASSAGLVQAPSLAAGCPSLGVQSIPPLPPLSRSVGSPQALPPVCRHDSQPAGRTEGLLVHRVSSKLSGRRSQYNPCYVTPCRGTWGLRCVEEGGQDDWMGADGFGDLGSDGMGLE